MSEEAKFDCQHCGGHIEFPAEMAGQTINCPHCQLETQLVILPDASPPASDPQPQGENSSRFKLFDFNLSKEYQLGDADYILYLEPGDVRHLQVGNFIKFKVDWWIAYFKQMSLTPEISGPYNGKNEGLEPVTPELFFSEITWEDKFKILHSFALLHRDYGVPSTVYRYFHRLLKLHSLEFSECINSWVKEAWKDWFIGSSKLKDPNTKDEAFEDVVKSAQEAAVLVLVY